VTDGQTDGRTDGRAIAYSALSMLSRAKNECAWQLSVETTVFTYCNSILIFTLSYQVAELKERLSAIVTMKCSRKLSRSGWRDGQKISILVELTVCQKNVANALHSVGIMLKNKM